MTRLAALNADYGTIGEMAESHQRIKMVLARRAIAHLSNITKQHPRLKTQLGVLLVLGALFVSIIGTVPIVHAQSDSLGCPGGPHTTGTHECPGGGRIINGVFFPDDTSGHISGKVLQTAGCTQASCGCANATVNVTRVSGTASGDTTTKTSADGTYSLTVGAGVVTLTTPDCKKSDGTYSGTSAQITVAALTDTGNHNYVATKLAQAGGTSDAVCDNTDFTELNFWVCGFINLVAKTAEGLDSAIIAQLKVNTDVIFNDSGNSKTGNAYFLAWAAFRNIAYAILVLFALIMIASQILGLDFVDAYTLRKMLPRIIIASILIAVSWNGMDFLFNLSNDAADAIRAIIAAPFHNIDVGLGNTGTNAVALVTIIPTLLTTGAAAGVATLALLGIGGIAALLATVVLAVFSAWVLLVGRDVVAAMLIVMSPIAIIAWAFGR